MAPLSINIAWLIFAGTLAWFVLERKRPKGKRSIPLVVVVAFATLYTFNMLYETVTLYDVTDSLVIAGIAGTLFGGAVQLLIIVTIWRAIANWLSSRNAKTPSEPKGSISLQQKATLILIIAVIAVGSIAYLNNVANYKISRYITNSDSLEAFLELTDYEEKLIVSSDPYINKKRQNFYIYSTSIIIVALGLSYVVIRPKRKESHGKRINQQGSE